MSSDPETFSDIYKGKLNSVVIIGASNVGKTALVYRYVINELPSNLTSTVGVEFTKRVVTQKSSGSRIQLHIWDTAGQEKFKSVTKHYYRGTDICLLTFDLSDSLSFDSVEHWVTEIKNYTPEGCVVVLLGNKADLAIRSVEREKALNYAKLQGFYYFETSALWNREDDIAKDGVSGGVETVLDVVISQIYKNHTTKEEVVLNKEVKGIREVPRCEC
jgi:small GTP-binding protein